MWIADGWKDYELLSCGGGEKLERWDDQILVRPDPQAIWQVERSALWRKANARYSRSQTGGGHWEKNSLPQSWPIHYKELTFQVKPMNFKHTGLFPEQAVNWDFAMEKIRNAGRPIRVLNLFAYTGGATVACAKAGASVCHVDAAKGMVSWARENAKLSGLEEAPSRWIIDDCAKFVEREIRRGKTYDAIIKTFGNMHSLAVEGKWNRSKWIGGAYDEGMIFRSEADFVLYNKLFAAYFLVTKEKIATVGSAKKDLNGDGVEELILLDGNFNIFAIFTQVDGEVVLLDSYNDLRTAFIDADGLIHVKERIIPGYYKDSKNDGIKCDYEAFVYEIRDGKLVEKIAIGIKFDAKGDQEKIYKLSVGTAIDIEQSEWDALYADFTLDLGEATFAAYTKEKSGLVFVEALLV